MEREKTNPYVTRIELRDKLGEMEKDIKADIKSLSSKQTDDNLFNRTLLTELSTTMTHVVKSNDKTANAIIDLTKEMRDKQQKTDEIISTHEEQLRDHNKFITDQQKILEGKRGSTLKWIGVLVPVFIAFIGGIFGIVEILIPWLIGL